MRKTFPNRQLAHVWAQQSQPEGRGSHFYFEGPTLYSYGRHFPVARFVEPEDGGRPVVLFNTERYSNSTNKHQSFARGALYGLPVRVFYVPDLDAQGCDTLGLNTWRHERNRTHYREKIAAAIESAARARNYAQLHLDTATRAAAEAAEYAAAFRLLEDWAPTLGDVPSEGLAAVRELAKQQAAEVRAREKARAAARAVAGAEGRAEWRRGENSQYFGEPTMLRLSRDGESIETSRGAEVPVEDARRVLRLRRDFPGAREWPHGEGPRVGAFTLREVTADGALVIGCHRLEADELERIAGELGVTA